MYMCAHVCTAEAFVVIAVASVGRRVAWHKPAFKVPHILCL